MRRVVVRSVEPLSESVKNIRFACVDGEPLQYVPGQWINVRIPVGELVEKRAYSIASAPNAAHADEFELAVTRVETGKVSRTLHALAIGQELDIDGPHGFFTRKGREEKPALFVGTGTGVSPLRSMIEAELAQAGGPTLTLLFGCRGEGDILYRAEFERLAREHARFMFEPTLSRPDAGWRGRSGYVQAQLAEMVALLGGPDVWVCGLSEMVDAVRATLKGPLGYERSRIHSERYD